MCYVAAGAQQTDRHQPHLSQQRVTRTTARPSPTPLASHSLDPLVARIILLFAFSPRARVASGLKGADIYARVDFYRLLSHYNAIFSLNVLGMCCAGSACGRRFFLCCCVRALSLTYLCRVVVAVAVASVMCTTDVMSSTFVCREASHNGMSASVCGVCVYVNSFYCACMVL